jgi:hypothetical protein
MKMKRGLQEKIIALQLCKNILREKKNYMIGLGVKRVKGWETKKKLKLRY